MLRSRYKNALARIEVQRMRRDGLISNLIEPTTAYIASLPTKVSVAVAAGRPAQGPGFLLWAPHSQNGIVTHVRSTHSVCYRTELSAANRYLDNRVTIFALVGGDGFPNSMRGGVAASAIGLWPEPGNKRASE